MFLSLYLWSCNVRIWNMFGQHHSPFAEDVLCNVCVCVCCSWSSLNNQLYIYCFALLTSTLTLLSARRTTSRVTYGTENGPESCMFFLLIGLLAWVKAQSLQLANVNAFVLLCAYAWTQLKLMELITRFKLSVYTGICKVRQWTGWGMLSRKKDVNWGLCINLAVHLIYWFLFGWSGVAEWICSIEPLDFRFLMWDLTL